MKKFTIILLLLFSITCAAQEPSWLDTLDAAVKTDYRRIEASLGHLQTGIEGIRGIVSPVGEGDPIRWVQSLPGVTTGADGTTAMYVRGGGSGNNLFTLDGVPVYGYSHILGLTTLVPTSVIESAELSKGGFDGDESNFTASHLKVVTKRPEGKGKLNFALNNFLLCTGLEGGGRNVNYLFSARVSPLALEYRAVKNKLPRMLGGLNNFGAFVGDAYGKINIRLNDASYLTASALASQDHYSFDMSNASHEAMGWNNILGMLQYHQVGENMRIDVTASYNKFGSLQQQDKRYYGRMNHLSLSSGLTEYSLQAKLHHSWDSPFVLDEGLTFRYAQFSPGQVGEISKRTDVILATPWVQATYSIPDQLTVKAVLRGNYYHSIDLNRPAGEENGSGRIDPEVSLAAKWTFTPHLAFEATFDRLVQYYHTLEGMPVGWSLDLIVPTVGNVLPEKSLQGGAGLSGRFGDHSLSVGGFYKLMNNLIYYKYSQELFSGGLSGWAQHVELGDGRSYGLETLYEYQQGDWYGRASYTLSKTTRENFPSFYEGAPFHARFDRRHMLNATLQWKGFSATMILQSGHWENGEAVSFETIYMMGKSFTSKYYSGVNNYHMPTVFRLDLGWQKTFNIRRSEHTVNVGVCNVTNHFNPFMLYFDAETESWKEIALMPILPNFSWRVTF